MMILRFFGDLCADMIAIAPKSFEMGWWQVFEHVDFAPQMHKALQIQTYRVLLCLHSNVGHSRDARRVGHLRMHAVLATCLPPDAQY